MESAELYQHLLGLNTPWTVSRVDLDMAKQRVDVHVGHADGARFACPECGQSQYKILICVARRLMKANSDPLSGSSPIV